MKNSFLFILSALLVLIISCKEKTNHNKSPQTNKSESKVIFKIDERTEFFRTIFNIAAQDVLPEDFRPCQTEYLKDVNNHFLKFKTHPMIHWVYDDEEIGIDFSTIGLMFEDLETFEFDSRYSAELNSFGVTEKTLDSIRPLLIDFYKASDFESFFKSHQDYYKKAISNIEKEVSEATLFDKVMDFYQEYQCDLELIVFVELTNNANNKAVEFYDHYNPKKRAIILANICGNPSDASKSNDVLELDNDLRGILYHETSHLFTSKSLNKYIGELDQYNSICEDCSDVKIKDKIDHMIVSPLQALMMQRFDGNDKGSKFYMKECDDVRKEIFQRLNDYHPEDTVRFENVYSDCINLIKNSAKEKA